MRSLLLILSVGSWEDDRNFILRVILDSKGKLASQVRIMTGLGQRIRDMRTGPDGYVFALTDETAGAILRLESGRL